MDLSAPQTFTCQEVEVMEVLSILVYSQDGTTYGFQLYEDIDTCVAVDTSAPVYATGAEEPVCILISAEVEWVSFYITPQ